MWIYSVVKLNDKSDTAMQKIIVFVVLHLAALFKVNCLYNEDKCLSVHKSGTCLPLAACRPLMNEISEAGNPMPRYMSKKLHSLSCGFDSHGPMVCCKSVNTINENSDESESKERPNNNNSVDKGNKVKDNITKTNSRHGGDLTEHPNFHLLPKDCGVSNGDRIAGGDITGLYELPWMVLISYNHIDLGPYYGCGGTLINEWYVLTAAHCINLLSGKLTLNGVILGEHDTRKDPDCLEPGNCAPPVRNVTINETIVHQGYKKTRLFNDIALIRLSEPADFSLNSMKPICLPVTSEMQYEAEMGTKAAAAGWGITEEDIQSPILLSVQLPIIPINKCRTMYKGLLALAESQLCAGGVKDKDSCSGDSGGPLLYVSQIGSRQRYMQRGIVSYGSRDCAIGGYPTIYTKVSYFMEWILDNIHN